MKMALLFPIRRLPVPAGIPTTSIRCWRCGWCEPTTGGTNFGNGVWTGNRLKWGCESYQRSLNTPGARASERLGREKLGRNAFLRSGEYVVADTDPVGAALVVTVIGAKLPVLPVLLGRTRTFRLSRKRVARRYLHVDIVGSGIHGDRRKPETGTRQLLELGRRHHDGVIDNEIRWRPQQVDDKDGRGQDRSDKGRDLEREHGGGQQLHVLLLLRRNISTFLYLSYAYRRALTRRNVDHLSTGLEY